MTPLEYAIKREKELNDKINDLGFYSPSLAGAHGAFSDMIIFIQSSEYEKIHGIGE
jgi:hypothetical protein